jgi:hypothetical protein
MTAEEIVQGIRLFFEIIGALTILVTFAIGLMTFFGWAAGVTLVMKRLGLGRWYRKVLIVGSSGETKSLRRDIEDSGVFRKNNIEEVDERNLVDVKRASLILLDYWSLEVSQVAVVLANKQKHAGLVVYSPMGKGRIPDEISATINNEPFTTLVQMRGRLVNDLLITLMSTSYDKKFSK